MTPKGVLESHKGGTLLSTRYTYVRRSWPDDAWRKNVLMHDLLRWGPDADPLLGIGLGLAWSFHSKDDNFPTLTPQWPYDIPTWYLACSLAERYADCFFIIDRLTSLAPLASSPRWCVKCSGVRWRRAATPPSINCNITVRDCTCVALTGPPSF